MTLFIFLALLMLTLLLGNTIYSVEESTSLTKQTKQPIYMLLSNCTDWFAVLRFLF